MLHVKFQDYSPFYMILVSFSYRLRALTFFGSRGRRQNHLRNKFTGSIAALVSYCFYPSCEYLHLKDGCLEGTGPYSEDCVSNCSFSGIVRLAFEVSEAMSPHHPPHCYQTPLGGQKN